MKSRLRDGLIRGLAPVSDLAHRERPRVRVLSFHDVPVEVRSTFAERIRWLAGNYRIASLAEAQARSGLDEARLNVALTFDDGFAEHGSFVPELLAELNAPATFFVPNGSFDLAPAASTRFAAEGLRRRGSFAFMSSAEGRALAAHPLFEIGAHTASHPDLAQLGEAALEAEVVRAKAELEELVGRPVQWFAFPFGSPQNLSRGALRAIASAGYRAAFTILPGFWSRARDPYLVGRDCLPLEADTSLWKAWLRGGYDAVSWIKRQ